jgi:hypothetical protein
VPKAAGCDGQGQKDKTETGEFLDDAVSVLSRKTAILTNSDALLQRLTAGDGRFWRDRILCRSGTRIEEGSTSALLGSIRCGRKPSGMIASRIKKGHPYSPFQFAVNPRTAVASCAIRRAS